MNPSTDAPIRIALAGVGKMGLSHQAIVNAHPALKLVAICDPARYVRDIIARYTGVATYSDFVKMLECERPNAVLIATPSKLHAEMTRAALERDIDVFCEKPFCLDVDEGARLAEMAERKGIVTQVGYHNRFVGTFEEARRLLDAGAIGKVYHAKVECYGPVMIRQKGATWRTDKAEGGGCLYDYACHGIDLLTYLIGAPVSVSGSVLRSVFSTHIDDEVYSNLSYADGTTAQVSANWSDESFRKMSTTVTLWGKNGKIEASRQELNVYLRDKTTLVPELDVGWNKRYTTALTKPVWFYLRGEEYSAQIDYFVDSIRLRRVHSHCNARSALATDVVADMIRQDAALASTPSLKDRPSPVRSSGGEAEGWPRSWRGVGESIMRSPKAIANVLKGG